MTDCKLCTVPTNNPEVCSFCLDYQPPADALRVEHPSWLIATGDTERLEVLRSPLVTGACRMYEPVRRFIADNGLVLAARETFEDPEWMHGSVEVSVFVPPASRNASYALL